MVVISPVQFSFGTTCEPNRRQVIVEFGGEVGRTAERTLRLRLLRWDLIWRRVVCSLPLSFLRPLHGRRLWRGEQWERSLNIKQHFGQPRREETRAISRLARANQLSRSLRAEVRIWGAAGRCETSQAARQVFSRLVECGCACQVGWSTAGNPLVLRHRCCCRLND